MSADGDGGFEAWKSGSEEPLILLRTWSGSYVPWWCVFRVVLGYLRSWWES